MFWPLTRAMQRSADLGASPLDFERVVRSYSLVHAEDLVQRFGDIIEAIRKDSDFVVSVTSDTGSSVLDNLYINAKNSVDKLAENMVGKSFESC